MKMRMYFSGCTFSGGEPEQHLKRVHIMMSFLEVRERKGKNWRRFKTIKKQRKVQT
jgi:hypothetical protein